VLETGFCKTNSRLAEGGQWPGISCALWV